ARFAMEYAAAAKVKRLHVVHKRTALPQTEGLFIGAFEALQGEFPDLELNLLRVDTFSSSFPRQHKEFRLVATTNLFGDILSDQASGLAGGVGLAASLNAGADHAMAQAVHGTAADIAGKGLANPAALILSTALLLRWLYQRSKVDAARATARIIEDAVAATIRKGTVTADLGGSATTGAFTKAVIDELASAQLTTAQARLSA